MHPANEQHVLQVYFTVVLRRDRKVNCLLIFFSFPYTKFSHRTLNVSFLNLDGIRDEVASAVFFNYLQNLIRRRFFVTLHIKY